ncbi:MAG TPA: hypothetical protein VKB27_14300 [Gammaproteobacteria bacterium]|nr:hypothetical protein [Gammaproteobacteria bacterium]
MQCYRYLASTLSIANALEKIPGAPKKLPPSVVADWMDENYIDADEAFLISEDEIRAAVERLVQLARPHIAHAA